MKTPKTEPWTLERRLAFAVDFANRDLARLRPSDWSVLRDDLRLFFGTSGSPRDLGVIASPTERLDDYPTSAIATLQAAVQKVLAGVVGAHAKPTEKDGMTWKGWGVARVAVAVEKSILLLPGGRLFNIVGPVRDVFLEQLLFLLAIDASDRIRACPQCGRLFYRVRRQQYCRRACVNKAYQGSPKYAEIRKRLYEEHGWRLNARKGRGKVATKKNG